MTNFETFICKTRAQLKIMCWKIRFPMFGELRWECFWNCINGCQSYLSVECSTYSGKRRKIIKRILIYLKVYLMNCRESSNIYCLILFPNTRPFRHLIGIARAQHAVDSKSYDRVILRIVFVRLFDCVISCLCVCQGIWRAPGSGPRQGGSTWISICVCV